MRFVDSGPEGIRTLGLLSAIEARSQLRYRPIYKATAILPEAFADVNESFTADSSRVETSTPLHFICILSAHLDGIFVQDQSRRISNEQNI